MVRRAFVLVGLALLLLAAGLGVGACATESDAGGELNPQPLPPGDDRKGANDDFSEGEQTGGSPATGVDTPAPETTDGGASDAAEGG